VRKIIVIGSGYSGSGAVVEYLTGRPDVSDPFQGHEFRLIQDPDGLMDLYNLYKNNYSVQGTSAAINDFISFWKRIQKHTVLKESAPVEKFIKQITALEYKAAPYCERIKMNFLKRRLFEYQEKWAHCHGRKPELVTMRIPVDLEQFLLSAQKFIDEIILSAVAKNKNICVINHGASFWRPVSSTIFYGDRKVIIVTRDVRDIYSELSTIGRAYPKRDPALFCSWFRSIMEKVEKSEWEHEDVVSVGFEDFVQNNKDAVIKLSDFLGINQCSNSSYDPEKSKLNIGKFKTILSMEEIKCIESKLKEYCYL